MQRQEHRNIIYLTDQLEQNPNVRKLSKEILFSITPFYKNPEKADKYREQFTSEHRLAEDSGGFQFLMGKLPLDKCDPMKTVEVYKRIGVQRKDFPIQLDLPPQFHLSHEQRLFLIHKSAMFYHQMAEEIDWTVPVVHGWTADELATSLTLIEDPDRLAVGTNIATTQRTSKISSGTFSGAAYSWVMGKLNSHTPRFVATPNNGAPPTTIITDHIKSVAAGAFQQSGRFVLDEVGRNKKISTPGCTAEGVVQRTPLKVIWERLALVLNLLKDRELFMLGAASPHDTHMLFLGGAKWGDTSSWRLKAYLAEIYIPEHGSICIGYKGGPPKPEHAVTLRECLRDQTHPQSGMSLNRFLQIGRMNMKEWRETYPANQWEIKPFHLRAMHNAWVLKFREQTIANEYACDPDRYHHYLKEHRFKGHPNLQRKLKFLWSRYKRPYVQESMDVFLKGDKL